MFIVKTGNWINLLTGDRMIFTYDLKDRKIVLPRETTFKEHNILERKNIEKWIEEYPEILGEELLVLTTEFDRFDRTSERLDILALDIEGNLVVIELKRDDTGKNAELQALKYAAYCSTLNFDQVIDLHKSYLLNKGENSTDDIIRKKILNFIQQTEFEEINDRPRIFLLAKEYRPEVTASVLWLRKFGIDITCVKLTPYSHDGASLTIESSILIPVPEAKDYLIKVENKEKFEISQSRSKQEYLEFYLDLVKQLSDELPGEYPDPSPRNYYYIRTGMSNVHYEWIFRGRPRSSFGVELHFENPDKALNESLLNHFLKFKQILEEKTGEEVIFRSWSRRWTRIYIQRKEGEMSEDLMKWAVNNMKIFIEIIQPEIEKYLEEKW